MNDIYVWLPGVPGNDGSFGNIVHDTASFLTCYAATFLIVRTIMRICGQPALPTSRTTLAAILALILWQLFSYVCYLIWSIAHGMRLPAAETGSLINILTAGLNSIPIMMLLLLLLAPPSLLFGLVLLTAHLLSKRPHHHGLRLSVLGVVLLQFAYIVYIIPEINNAWHGS